jgi:hypothetical protein
MGEVARTWMGEDERERERDTHIEGRFSGGDLGRSGQLSVLLARHAQKSLFSTPLQSVCSYIPLLPSIRTKPHHIISIVSELAFQSRGGAHRPAKNTSFPYATQRTPERPSIGAASSTHPFLHTTAPCLLHLLRKAQQRKQVR